MAPVVEEVFHKLGGKPVFGRELRSQADLAMAVSSRLPLTVLRALVQAGFSEQEIERHVIPSGRAGTGRARDNP